MPDRHTEDSPLDRHELEHLLLDPAMPLPQLVRIREHVLREDLPILLHNRLHRKLDKHLVRVLSRRHLDNLFLRRFVVKAAPHELLQRFSIHPKLLRNPRAQRI